MSEVLDFDQSSAACPDAAASAKNETQIAVPSRYDQGRYIGELLGTLRYRNRRYHNVQRRYRGYYGTKQEIEETIVEYQGPSWLVNRAWRLRVIRALSGWTFCCQTYNVIPSDAPVIEYVRQNNVNGLQDLFSRKLASPFDCDGDNWTLLLVSMRTYPIAKCSDTHCTSGLRTAVAMMYVNF